MKTFFSILLLLISLNVTAQFDVASGEQVGLITIEGTDHLVYKTTNGSEYIICNSPRTNNDYAVWIGKETKDKDETGQSIRQSKSGKYFIFVISEKTHNPYCKYLKDKKKV